MTKGKMSTSRRSSVGTELMVGFEDGATDSVGIALGFCERVGLGDGFNEGDAEGTRDG